MAIELPTYCIAQSDAYTAPPKVNEEMNRILVDLPPASHHNAVTIKIAALIQATPAHRINRLN